MYILHSTPRNFIKVFQYNSKSINDHDGNAKVKLFSSYKRKLGVVKLQPNIPVYRAHCTPYYKITIKCTYLPCMLLHITPYNLA